MKNYTIWNCPNMFWTSLDCVARCKSSNNACAYQTSCLLKDIWETCEKALKNQNYTQGERFLAMEISKKFDVREARDD